MSRKMGFAVMSMIAVLLLALPILTACSSNNDNKDNETSSTGANETTADHKTTKFIIGNHTDMTGVAANSMSVITIALEDMVAYYTDNNVIPGMTFEVKTYDGQFDPAKDIPGYEWLKERGADVIFSPVAATTVTLKPLLAEDEMVLFSVMPEEAAYNPPGWVFAVGQTSVKYEMYTLLKWLAENDPNFPKDRPAKLGGAFWNEPYGLTILEAMEEYSKANPDQYEWVDGLVNNYSFVWTTEVQALKDCDYIAPPVPPSAFIRQYRESGFDAQFIGTDAHIAFLGQLEDAGLWDEFDGLWLIKPAQWWNDEGEIVDLTKELLATYHSESDAAEIRKTGISYMATQQLYVMFELIRATAEAVGPENVNSGTIFETAKTFSTTVDGCPHSFGPEKRTSSDALAVYQLRASEKDMVRADPAWLPVVYEP